MADVSSSATIIDFLKRRQLVNVGQAPNDDSGDFIRDAYIILNEQITQIVTLLDALGLSAVPEDAKAVLSSDERLNNYYAKLNGDVNENFASKIIQSVEGIMLGADGVKNLFVSKEDLYGFVQYGIAGTFLVNNIDSSPTLAMKLGAYDPERPNDVVFGINYMDPVSSSWKSLFRVHASGRISVFENEILDENGQIPYERLRAVTGDVDEEFNTLEKISQKIKSAPEMAVFHFATKALTWVIAHNRSNRFHTVQLFDVNDYPIMANYKKGENETTVYFSSSQDGYAILTFPTEN